MKSEASSFLPLLIVASSFWTITILTVMNSKGRKRLLRRNALTWVTDLSGLLIQGLAVPLLQAFVLTEIWALILPDLRGSFTVSPLPAFLISFVAIDYAYYWNHRLFHATKLWKWHRLHHSSDQIDVFVTSRNSVLTPLFIVYLWLNSLVVYLFNEPQAFLIASALGAALDLWRHSGFSVVRENAFVRICSKILILPQDHAWHHSTEGETFNFGANLKCWDVLHGTYMTPTVQREFLGHDEESLVSVRELIWPKAVAGEKGGPA